MWLEAPHRFPGCISRLPPPCRAGRSPGPSKMGRKIRPWEGQAQPNRYVLHGHQSPNLIDQGREQEGVPSLLPRLLPAPCPILGKIPALSPFPAGPGLTQGAPNRHGVQGGQGTGRLECRRTQDPPRWLRHSADCGDRKQPLC